MFEISQDAQPVKKKFLTKASFKLTVILLTSMFILNGPLVQTTQAAQLSTQAQQSVSVTQEVVRASNGTIQYKTQNPGVKADVSAYVYDTGIKVTLDGKPVQLTHDGIAQAYPILVNGRTFVPLRAVAELLGAKVTFDNANAVIIITLEDGTTLETYDGANVIIKNGKDVQGIRDGVRVFIKDGRTYMPIRAAVEAVGFGVDWQPNTRTIEITSPGVVTQPAPTTPTTPPTTQPTTPPTQPTQNTEPKNDGLDAMRDVLKKNQEIRDNIDKGIGVHGELKPTTPGTKEGQLSPQGDWMWSVDMQIWCSSYST